MGDIAYKLTEVGFGGKDMGSVRVASYTGYDLVNKKTQEPFTVLKQINMAYLGQDLLWAYDVARDRTGGTLTFRHSDETTRESPIDFMVAQALKAVQPKESEGESETQKRKDTPALPEASARGPASQSLHRGRSVGCSTRGGDQCHRLG